MRKLSWHFPDAIAAAAPQVAPLSLSLLVTVQLEWVYTLQLLTAPSRPPETSVDASVQHRALQ